MALMQAVPCEYSTLRWSELRCLHCSTFFATVRVFFRFLSAASLFALYSILFCSKFGSFKYSSKDPTRDTGACRKTVGKTSIQGRRDLTCFKLGMGTLSRF